MVVLKTVFAAVRHLKLLTFGPVKIRVSKIWGSKNVITKTKLQSVMDCNRQSQETKVTEITGGYLIP